jgi:hypothetical protein
MTFQVDFPVTCRCTRFLLETINVVLTLRLWMRRLLGILLPAALLLGLIGCGPEGAGTIKIDPGARERALNPGGDAAAKPATGKQAKAKEAENAAAKKNNKLY